MCRAAAQQVADQFRQLVLPAAGQLRKQVSSMNDCAVAIKLLLQKGSFV
jgi:hypothetical protein